MNTKNMLTQETPVPDLTVFFGASQFRDASGNGVFALPGAGLPQLTLANNLAGNFVVDMGLFFRTGVYATPALMQRQFGTSAGTPGPSSVANTSGPLALPTGFPPTLGAKLATRVGGAAGPIPKGIQINSIDVIYTVAGLAAALAQVGLTATQYANNAAPTVTNLIALGANGLPTAIQAQPYVKNVAVPVPAFVITPDTEAVLNVKLTSGATGTIAFAGVCVNASYNFN